MIKEVLERDTQECGVIIFDFLDVGIFDGVNDLIFSALSIVSTLSYMKRAS